MSSLLDAPPALADYRGVQTPRIRVVPAYDSTAGDDVIDLAAAAGLVLDPWQELAVRDALGETADGKWASFEVGLILSRQNGKDSVIEALELGWLFLFGDRLVLHSAHEFKTTQEHFRRVRDLIDGSDALRRRVARVRTANGEEQIELKTGQRLRFIARSKGSGRGFSPDKVVLNEALILPEAAVAALLPAMSARPNPQVVYASSPPDKDKHEHCEVLTRLRRRALAGEERITYHEFSPDVEGMNEFQRAALRRNPRAWAISNPGLGIRISAEFIQRELGALAPKTFDVERLGIGDWPDEAQTERFLTAWLACADATSVAAGRPAFAVDVSPGSRSAAIVAATRRPDGRPHLEVVEHLPGVDWVPGRCQMLKANDPLGWVLDPAGPAGSLLPDLAKVGIEPRQMSTRDMGQACEALTSTVAVGGVVHLDDPILTGAVAGAGRRDIGDGLWAWSRRKSGTDICPLVAVTEAHWLLSTQVVSLPAIY